MTDYKIEKLSDQKWLNLYNVHYRTKDNKDHKWQMASRKENPIKDVNKPDAVYIVAAVEKRLVVTKEFRVPLWDYEYGFPAGLIDNGESIQQAVTRELKEETGLNVIKITNISKPIYSSAGMTDESCVMVFLEAEGKLSNKHLEGTEDIETCLMDQKQVKKILESDFKIAAKAWGIFNYFASCGKFNFS